MSGGKTTSMGKADLRRLMQQKKDALQQGLKKIDSPLAKYSSSGQLICVACRAPVKSELAWTAHLAGRSHRDQVAALKNRQEANKRPADATAASGTKHKRYKGGGALPGDFFEKPQAPKKSILKNAPARPTYAQRPAPSARLEVPDTSQGEQMDTDDSGPASHSPADAAPPADGVSTDGSSTGPSGSSTAAEPELDTGQLPEGFFDDPQKDAKARHVEYVDPVEAEWEKFQREMQTEMAESEVILDEDQQEATVGRQIEEVDEQIRNLSRVVSMEKRKEQLAHQEAAATAARGDGSDSSADEAEVEEFLDWRSKGTWK